MNWNAQNYHATCGRVTEHGMKLVEVLRDMRCNKILDLGCGTGVLTNEIAGFAGEVVGLDASPAMLEKAAAAYPELQFVLLDACAMRWESAFDAIFSNAVLHFIKEQEVLLERIHRALVQNGAFVAEFGAAGNIRDLLDAVSAACKARGKSYTLRFYYPAEEEYRQLLEKHHFSIESLSSYDLDTQLTEGEPGLRNWVKQVFSVEMAWFEDEEREEVLGEIETALRPTHWDGSNWHLPNRRLQVVARKA